MCNHRSAHSDPSIHPSIHNPSSSTQHRIHTHNTKPIHPNQKKNEKVGSTNSIGQLQHLKVTRIEQQKKVRSKQQTGKHLVIREREILHKSVHVRNVTYMYIIHADQEKIGEKKKKRKEKVDEIGMSGVGGLGALVFFFLLRNVL